MHSQIKGIRLLRRLKKRFQLKRLGRNERGVQLVEVAIVLPVFLFFLGATAEFGRFFYEYSTLAKAARLGARYLATAAVKPTADQNAANLVVFGSTSGTGTPVLTGLTTANVTIVRSGGTAALPQTVTVQITGFQHQPIFDLGQWTNIPSLSLNINVQPSVTMRYLLNQPAI